MTETNLPDNIDSPDRAVEEALAAWTVYMTHAPLRDIVVHPAGAVGAENSVFDGSTWDQDPSALIAALPELAGYGKQHDDSMSVLWRLFRAVGRLQPGTIPATIAEGFGALPRPVLLLAIIELLRHIQFAQDHARQLLDESNPAEDPLVEIDSFLDLLEERLDIRLVADQIRNHVNRIDGSTASAVGQLREWYQRISEAEARLDAALQDESCVRQLSAVAGLPALDNWRHVATSVGIDPVPWWLDGRLELTAQREARLRSLFLEIYDTFKTSYYLVGVPALPVKQDLSDYPGDMTQAVEVLKTLRRATVRVCGQDEVRLSWDRSPSLDRLATLAIGSFPVESGMAWEFSFPEAAEKVNLPDFALAAAGADDADQADQPPDGYQVLGTHSEMEVYFKWSDDTHSESLHVWVQYFKPLPLLVAELTHASGTTTKPLIPLERQGGNPLLRQAEFPDVTRSANLQLSIRQATSHDIIARNVPPRLGPSDVESVRFFHVAGEPNADESITCTRAERSLELPDTGDRKFFWLFRFTNRMPALASDLRDEAINIESLLLKYYGPVRGLILKKMTSTQAADDICQEVFLKVHRYRHRWGELNNLSAWIFEVTRNTISDYWRALRPLIHVDPGSLELTFDDETINKVLDNEELVDIINQSMSRLNDRDRGIIKSMLSQVPLDELAEQLDLSYESAKRARTRACERFRNAVIETRERLGLN